MSTLELIDNIFQLVMTLGVGITACLYAIKQPRFLPFQYLAGISFSAFMGTIYWTIYFIIYSQFPYYFSASELCYMAMYLFLIGVCLLLFKPYKEFSLTHKQLGISLFFALWVFLINFIYYFMWGGLFYTLYYCIPLMIIAFLSCRNAFALKGKPLYSFNIAIICFIIVNNMMYFVSSFMWNTLYVLFDMMLTLTFLAMLLCLKKEIKL